MTIFNTAKHITWKTAVLMLLLMIVLIARPGYCQPDGYALMIQPSPADGGTVKPTVGVYRPQLNEVVTLTAIPTVGYRFVYWLGDVTDVTANETTIYVNSPKMVVAVFERTEFEAPEEVEDAEDKYESGAGGGDGGGGFQWSPYPRLNRGGRGGGGGGGYGPRGEDDYSREWPGFPTPDVSDANIPVPDEPIPEPATMTLLGLGAASLMTKRRKRKI